MRPRKPSDDGKAGFLSATLEEAKARAEALLKLDWQIDPESVSWERFNLTASKVTLIVLATTIVGFVVAALMD